MENYSAENIFLTRSSPTYLIDPSLELKTAGVCDLLVILSNAEAVLSLKERRSGNILAFESIRTEEKKRLDWKELLENFSSQSKLLRNFEFSKVNVAIVTGNYTLIPEALFKPGDETTYWRKSLPFDSNILVKSQHVPAYHLYAVYGLDEKLEKELNHLFQDPQVFHHCSALFAGLSMLPANASGKQIWINVRTGFMDIVVTENKKLILMNSFACKTNEDNLYYLLFACEQLEINSHKTQVTVTGDIDAESSLYKILETYFPVGLAARKAQPSSVVEREIPFHRFSMLYYFSLCE